MARDDLFVWLSFILRLHIYTNKQQTYLFGLQPLCLVYVYMYIYEILRQSQFFYPGMNNYDMDWYMFMFDYIYNCVLYCIASTMEAVKWFFTIVKIHHDTIKINFTNYTQFAIIHKYLSTFCSNTEISTQIIICIDTLNINHQFYRTTNNSFKPTISQYSLSLPRISE